MLFLVWGGIFLLAMGLLAARYTLDPLPVRDSATYISCAEQIAASHHERWDGTGYPRGLKGESIPLSARIMAVADVFDALVSVRVYKDSVAPRDALDIIYSESGTHFDPDIIRVVRTVEEQMIAVADSRAANG